MTVQIRPVSRGNKICAVATLLLLAVVWASVPLFLSSREFVYSTFGKVEDATVTRRGGGWRSGGRGPGRPYVFVEYSFKDRTGKQLTGRDELPSGSDVQNGQPIKIVFVPGWTWMSRLEANKQDVTIVWLFCGGMSIVFAVIAWFISKLPSMGNIVTTSKPVKQNNPPSVWSQQDRRNTLIVCVVAALIIVVSLLLDRGVIGVMITFVILFALFALFAMDQQLRITRKRTHSMWSLAQELTWDFAADGNEKLHQGLSRFHLATLGQSSTLTNLMYGRCDGTDVAVFDYGYTHGKSGAVQTVVWMQRRGERMTEFSLRPESVWNQLGGWTAHGDINFDSHPEFSRSYLLRGDDEDAIRELFTDDLLRFYERHPNLITEGSGTKLLFYRDRIVVKPENLRSFLDEALAVRALFQPAR